MSTFFLNILSLFSPLHLNPRESVGSSGGEGVWGEVAAVETKLAATAEAEGIGGNDDGSNGNGGDDWWEESTELLVAAASSLRSGETVGRASKHMWQGWQTYPERDKIRIGDKSE